MYEKLKGKAISFEGGEGCGKTTIINEIEKILKKEIEVVKTREPGGNEICEKIRNILLDKNNTNITYETEALLFAASRAQHLEDVILKSIKNEKMVLLDRFIDSSLVYQGYMRDLGINKIYELNKFATKNWLPDLTILLDIDPKIGLKRIKSNNREINRLDLLDYSYHEKIREGYLYLSTLYSDRIKIVNACGTIEEVTENCLKIIHAYLEKL